MKKILSVLAILFLFASLMFVPLVSAAIVLTSSNTATPTTYVGVYNLVNNAYCGASESFVVNNDGYLAQMQFCLRKVGSPEVTLSARLVNSSNGLVSGYADFTEVYAESTNTIDSTDLTTSYVWYSFDFNSTLEITNGEVYFAVIYISGYVSADTSNYVRVGRSLDDASGYTRYTMTTSTQWVSGSNTDLVYRIYVSESAGVTPTPTPTSAGSSGSGDADMESLTAAILPFLVPLLVCLIPALLGYKFVGELGFFIGLNVGCILAYVTLAGTAYAFPLWGIILVGVMDVAVVLMRR